MTMDCSRRSFLKSAAVGGVLAVSGEVIAGEPAKNRVTAGAGLLDSAPALQNPSETTMDVVFAVSDLAVGFVELSESDDFAASRRVYAGDLRQLRINDRIAQVRLTGLRPSTRYSYRIGAVRIARARKAPGVDYRERLDEEVSPRVYRFTTLGAGAESHFAFLSDTHENWDIIARYHEMLAAAKVPLLILNGDACNCADTLEDLVRVHLKPVRGRADFAAEVPVCLNPGNHESRGLAHRELEKVFGLRDPSERSSRDLALGRNYAIRQGDIALIGLDTAESRHDDDPRCAGLQRSRAYRAAQTAWLADALKRPEIASAPFLVASCHIPLFSRQSNYNPGDLAPEEAKGRYSDFEAYWLRECDESWGRLLSEAKAQVVLTGHIHYHQWIPAAGQRTWGELVGGGSKVRATKRMPVKGGVRAENYNPTFVEGTVADGKLHVRVYNLGLDEWVADHVFMPRSK